MSTAEIVKRRTRAAARADVETNAAVRETPYKSLMQKLLLLDSRDSGHPAGSVLNLPRCRLEFNALGGRTCERR
jgi:hypothetical protein